MKLSDAFVPLNEKERTQLEDAVYRLMENDDFALLLRDWFEKANPLTPVFLDREGNNAVTAAKRDGEKNVTRYIIKLLMNKDVPRKKKTKRTTAVDPILDHMMGEK